MNDMDERNRIAEEYEAFLKELLKHHQMVDSLYGDKSYQKTSKDKWRLFWHSSALGGLITIILLGLLAFGIFYILTLL